jgi:archaellum component FlaF (FlaF/FlaG flagellin family)
VGLSVSASFAILTVAFFFGVAALVDVSFYSMDELMKGAEGVANERMEWGRTHIVLDNASINGTSVLVNLTNTGSTVLDVKGVSVLVNGTYVEQNITNATVEGKSSDIWSPNEKLRLELNITASSSERILVATGNGVLQYGVIA